MLVIGMDDEDGLIDGVDEVGLGERGFEDTGDDSEPLDSVLFGKVVRKLHTIRVEVGGTRDSGTAVIAWFDLLRVRRVDIDKLR